LDEPTSNIDDFHKKYALEMIKHLTKKSTLILVSHDPTIYNMFNRKIHINEGSVVSDQSTSNQFSAY
jgi:ABC-type lipoprotein export system ATPase subunit